MSQLTFGVLTVSDTGYTDPGKDRSGPRLMQLFRDSFSGCNVVHKILPDECQQIRDMLKKWICQEEPAISAIITTGGTGFSPRDVTPEATKPLLEKECPQMNMAIALASLQKTKFAALTRGVCGIAGNTLIINFPGSEKAVVECFSVIREILPHALDLIRDELSLVKPLHSELQNAFENISESHTHICPHKTGAGNATDRNSPFPMIPVSEAINIIFIHTQQKRDNTMLGEYVSPVDIPPFRASVKDGYAVKSSGFSGVKKVVGFISAGDKINANQLQEDECFKINTGAPIPLHTDCVIQIEDTTLVRTKKSGEEDLVDILVVPKPNLDIRPVGSDLRKGSKLFPCVDHSTPVIKSLYASVGLNRELKKPRIAIISTGNELQMPSKITVPNKIFDSNSTMLEELLIYFGFGQAERKVVVNDDFDCIFITIQKLFEDVDFIISSGGVSMGDKDYIKPALRKLGFEIAFGRVNMKPGKPMTFASKDEKYFFGLPGNPVSAFVTFHLFALPAIRWAAGWCRDKCELATVSVILESNNIPLDPRPEYVRASITSKNGQLFASVNGNQISSRLQSIVGSDVLLHLPARSLDKIYANSGDVLRASILRYDFISKYT